MSEDKTVVVDTRAAVARERFIAALAADIDEKELDASGHAVVDALEAWIRAILSEKKPRAPRKSKAPPPPPGMAEDINTLLRGVRLVASESPAGTQSRPANDRTMDIIR